jgi:hypothetical protein
MTLTGTVHPPGGAAAVLAVVDPTARSMGWNFVALISLAMLLMLTVASLFANACGRRYPVWWWSHKETGSWWRLRVKGDSEKDVEGQMVDVVEESSNDGRTFDALSLGPTIDPEATLVISAHGAFAGQNVHASPEEWAFLDGIVARLKAIEAQAKSEASAESPNK